MIDPELERAARDVRERAYAPYSGFLVGAALRDRDGRVHVGANVENASYPVGLCAERAALASAIAAGARDFVALAVVTAADAPTPPCGMCRQALLEFAPTLAVASVTLAGTRLDATLDALLPGAFDGSSLAKRA